MVEDEFFDIYTEQDELWKKEGEYHLMIEKGRQRTLQWARERDEQWLLERKRCPYCGWYKWPEEMGLHIKMCRERF